MSFRLGKIRDLVIEMERKNVDLTIIIDASTITYFTGFPYANGSMLLVHRDGQIELYVPVLDYLRAKDIAKDIEVKAYARYPLPDIEFENYIPKSALDVVVDIIKRKKFKYIGLDYTHSSHKIVVNLSKKLEGKISFIDLGEFIARIRAIKSSEELDSIIKAIDIAERSFKKTVNYIHEGATELEVAGALEYVMRKLGAEGFSFPTIVAFNENSVYPHARAGSRTLREKGVVLIDWGAKYNNYCSDITRTINYKLNSLEFKKVYEAVYEALTTAIDAIEPGKKGKEIDAIARNILRKHGLSKFFIHGLGHGIGVDVHEYPRLSPGSENILEPGMVVTVEPGVYINRLFGVRIEDIVLVTKDGRRVLTSIDRVINL